MDRFVELLQRYGLDPTNPDYAQLTDEQLHDLHSQLLNLFDEIRGPEDAPAADVDIAALERIAETSEALLAEDQARDEQAVAAAGRLSNAQRRTFGVRATPVSLQQAAAHRRRVGGPALDASSAGRATGGQFVAQMGERTGQLLAGADVAELVLDGLRSIEGFDQPRRRFRVAQARPEFGEVQRLDADVNENGRRIAAVVASIQEHGLEEGLVAAGGRCGPATPRYDQDVVGDDRRPVRDALAPFEARMAVRYVLPPTLADIDLVGSDAAVGVWTVAMDEAAVNDAGTRKPIQRVTCGSELEAETEAITERLLIGTILGRSNPERVRAFIHLTTVAHARLAEQRLLATIKAGSVQLQEDLQVLGSRRDLLAVWAKAAWTLRNRHRLDESTPLRLIAPDAVITHAQIDGLRQLPGDGRDRLTRAEVLGEMANLGVTVTVTPDMPAHLAGSQAAGAQLVDLPSPIEWSLSVEGTWGHLDGGELDLGFEAGTALRDSVRLAANDYELFAETFEKAVKFGGVESLWGRTLVCPTGATSATTDVDCGEAS